MAVSGVSATDAEIAHGTIVTEGEVIEQTIIAPEKTEAVVREYFADIPVMIAVAKCESTFRHTLSDGSVLRGLVDNRDTGVMQINTYYHGDTADRMGLDLEDLHDNLTYARDLYERQGTQPWNASRPCWGRTIAYNG